MSPSTPTATLGLLTDRSPLESTLDQALDSAIGCSCGDHTLSVVRELATLSGWLVDPVRAARVRWSEWGTVTPHLALAELHAADAARCLHHAAATFTHNSSLSTTSTLTTRRPCTLALPTPRSRP